jgi:hypothetical protein
VLLVGLGAKNAILIVEFVKANRDRGVGIVQAAVEERSRSLTAHTCSARIPKPRTATSTS